MGRGWVGILLLLPLWWPYGHSNFNLSPVSLSSSGAASLLEPPSSPSQISLLRRRLRKRWRRRSGNPSAGPARPRRLGFMPTSTWSDQRIIGITNLSPSNGGKIRAPRFFVFGFLDEFGYSLKEIGYWNYPQWWIVKLSLLLYEIRIFSDFLSFWDKLPIEKFESWNDPK